jgi:hypothetical protein
MTTDDTASTPDLTATLAALAARIEAALATFAPLGSYPEDETAKDQRWIQVRQDQLWASDDPGTFGSRNREATARCEWLVRVLTEAVGEVVAAEVAGVAAERDRIVRDRSLLFEEYRKTYSVACRLTDEIERVRAERDRLRAEVDRLRGIVGGGCDPIRVGPGTGEV